MTHPHLRERRPSPGPEVLRVMVFLPKGNRIAWVEKELLVTNVTSVITEDIREVMAALVDEPPPRPQLLVIDFDEVSDADLLFLHMLRVRGWFGRVFGIGKVSMALRRSLNVDRVFGAPLPLGGLRSALDTESSGGSTVRISRVVGG